MTQALFEGRDEGVLSFLASGDLEDEIEHKVRSHKGINGVPLFIVNGKLKMPGAQSKESFLEVLGDVAESAQ